MTVGGHKFKLRLPSGGFGETVLKNPVVSRVAVYFIQFALGLAMASARVFGSCGPFGIGLVAQSGGRVGGFCALVGASAGYLMTGGFDWGIRYVASAVLVFTVAFVFQELRIAGTNWFMPLATVGITACTAFLNSFEMAGDVPVIILSVTEIVLAGGSAYFFRMALSAKERTTEAEELRHTVSLIILLACALMALSGIVLFDVVSIGRAAAVLVVMTAAFKGGMMSGSAVGAALGLAMDVSSGGMPIFTMSYAFSGLLAGVFARSGKLFFALSYILANAVSVLWTWATAFRVEALYEAFAASVVFMLIPAGVLERIGGMLDYSTAGAGEGGLRRFAAARVRRMGDAFRDLYETVRDSVEKPSNDNDVALVFDRAADTSCAKCKNAAECWQRDYVTTLDAMNQATPAMMARGRLKRDDLPEYFLNNCLSPFTFISAVNGELRGLMYRRQFRSRLGENRTAAWTQYYDMAELLKSVADELGGTAGADALAERRMTRYLRGLDIDAEVSVFRDAGGRLRAIIDSGRIAALENEQSWLDKLSAVVGVRLCVPDGDRYEGQLTLMEAEPLAVSVGIASAKKKGEPVSGDRGTYFKTDAGVLCVILSDGMGTGEGAARESVAALRILERFLLSGVEPCTAMKILNSVMLLRASDDLGCAAVDLVCIDLFSGETCFYKYGAAPSYVRNGRIIRRVRGQSMAAGLCAGEGASPDKVRMRLKPGSLALIASDGVLPEDDDLWLRQLLSEFQGQDTKELARDAVQAAIRQYGCEDDMTVLAVYVDKRP